MRQRRVGRRAAKNATFSLWFVDTLYTLWMGEIELRGPRVVGRRLRVVYADGEPVWLGEGDMVVWYVTYTCCGWEVGVVGLD